MLNVRAIKDLIRQHNLGISPRRMGQHFLVDPKALARIAETVGAAPGERVLEIGAGLGALTEALLETSPHLTGVERDPRFAKILESRFGSMENFKLVQADILRLDLADYANREPHSLLIAGNIPYSITSPILEFLLHQRVWVKRAVLTIQKEVAQRIVAQPGNKIYSSVTLLVQVAFKPSIAFTISPGAFYPQPEVTSAVLRLDPLAEPPVPPEEEEAVRKLIRLIFTHRRKTVLNALCISGVGLSKEEVLSRFQEAGIDPVRRPETFDLQELVALHRILAKPR
ncbi:MAG: ribosomal RNA small subunit methyltransferase A [Candidatus Omnitrophica bacterium]|nr:ribosomal RNA small subunit methyltransferase A [Candidatus Omnitrophota bacterium]